MGIHNCHVRKSGGLCVASTVIVLGLGCQSSAVPSAEPSSEEGRKTLAVAREQIAGDDSLNELAETAAEVDDLIRTVESEDDDRWTSLAGVSLDDLRKARGQLEYRRAVVEQSLILGALREDAAAKLKAHDPGYYRELERSRAKVRDWERQRKAMQERLAQLEEAAEKTDEVQALTERVGRVVEDISAESVRDEWDSEADDFGPAPSSVTEMLHRMARKDDREMVRRGQRIQEETALRFAEADLATHRYAWSRLDRSEKERVVQLMPEYVCQNIRRARRVQVARDDRPEKPNEPTIPDAVAVKRKLLAVIAAERNSQANAYGRAYRDAAEGGSDFRGLQQDVLAEQSSKWAVEEMVEQYGKQLVPALSELCSDSNEEVARRAKALLDSLEP